MKCNGNVCSRLASGEEFRGQGVEAEEGGDHAELAHQEEHYFERHVGCRNGEWKI